MTKDSITIKSSLLFEYETSISYEDFINKEIYKIFSLHDQKIIISNSNGEQIKDNLLVDYSSYKSIFDSNFTQLDEYSLTLNIKDFLKIQIIEKLTGFGLSIGLLRKIFSLIDNNINEKFYSEENNIINILNTQINSKDKIDRIYGYSFLDAIRHKKIKDKRDNDQYKENYSQMKKSYNNVIFNFFLDNTYYNQQLDENYIIEYLIFNIVFLEEELYFCNYKNNHFFITNKDNLHEVLDDGIIVFNLNNLFSPITNKYKPEIIREYLKELGVNKQTFKKSDIPKEVSDIISNTDYIKLTLIKGSDGSINSIERNFHLCGENNRIVDVKKQYPFAKIEFDVHNEQINRLNITEKIKLNK